MKHRVNRAMKHRVNGVVLFLLAGALLYALTARAKMQSSRPVLSPTGRTAAPVFAAQDTDNNSWNLTNEQGKVVLVNFWASWCSPCRQETPDLVRIARHYQTRGLSVVGIAMDEGDGHSIDQFIRDYEIPYRIVQAKGTPVFPVQALPTTFLIDRQGRIANVYEGMVSEAGLKANIEALLTEK